MLKTDPLNVFTNAGVILSRMRENYTRYMCTLHSVYVYSVYATLLYSVKCQGAVMAANVNARTFLSLFLIYAVSNVYFQTKTSEISIWYEQLLFGTKSSPAAPRIVIRERNLGVYLGVKTCEVFLCFVAIVRVRVYYVDFFVFFVLRHWWVSKVFIPRMSQT